MARKMGKETNALNWFEIPATDIERAKKFYESIFDISMGTMGVAGMKMAMFPSEGFGGTVGGALVQSAGRKPSTSGVYVYLNANPDLQVVLDRIPKAGGTATVPKTMITKEYGYMAFFTDTEGNAVALHSNE